MRSSDLGQSSPEGYRFHREPGPVRANLSPFSFRPAFETMQNTPFADQNRNEFAPEEARGDAMARLGAAVAGLVAVILYNNTATFDFAYDDTLQILYNPQATSRSLSPWSILRLFIEPTPPGDLYRPLTTLTYSITWNLFGLLPGIFHLTNILIYGLLCAALVPFFNGILRSAGLSFAAALLFAVHPLHVESVANIVGRAEILAALFSIFGILATRRAARNPTAGNFVSVFVLAILAMFSKESSLALLPLYAVDSAILKDGAGLQKHARRFYTLLATTLVFAVAIVLLLRWFALSDGFFTRGYENDWVENPLLHLSFTERLFPALSILGRYIALLLLPLHLSADYSSTLPAFYEGIYSPAGIGHVAVFLTIVALFYVYRRERFAFFGLFFLMAFALTSNVVMPIGTVMGERLAFLPSIGFIGFFAALLDHLLPRERTKIHEGAVVAGSFSLIFAVLSWQRIPVWRNNLTLFRQTVEDAPDSPKAPYNYAVDLHLRHDDPLTAQQYFFIALTRNPRNLMALKTLADILAARGDVPRLRTVYERILALEPDDKDVIQNLKRLDELAPPSAAAAKAVDPDKGRKDPPPP